MVFCPRTFSCFGGVSRCCGVFSGLELALVDATQNEMDEGGAIRLRAAFCWGCGHSFFARTVTSPASWAYVPT